MKISKEIYTSVLEDCKIIIKSLGFDLKNADKGKSGIKPMYLLLKKISLDRSYDNLHPGFVSKSWKRILSFDDRAYCFYYANGCNDDHVATMLKSIQKELLSENL